MISDLDIYRTAKLLVDKHDNEAPIHAAMRADEFLAKGNLDGQATWVRVLAAAKELLATEPPEGKAIQ